MDLELALGSARRLAPLILPELTRLIAAKKRVMDRWPDIVPDPPERDCEAIIIQMLALLESNRWEDIKMSFVLRALKVAFGANFRNREVVEPIIDFAFAELDATTQSTFLNAMVAIYLSSYEPKAAHSLALGTKISAKRSLLNGKWRAIEETYPTLFDANHAHEDIAASMEEMEEPWQGLKAKGFPNPHATGLMDYIHAAYVDRMRPNLNMESWLDVLFKWLNPEPGKRKTSGSIEVIEAVLGHWVGKNASNQARETVTEHLINQYNDPRTNRSLWVGVSEDYMNVIFSWLTREDLRFFTSVVDATQKDPQWQPRKKFWLKLYDEGQINEAWVAFCPNAERYARTHLIRSGVAENVRRFGKQTKGGSKFDTSILIMRIGNKIVVDGCHMYRTHIFNVDDPVAPKLYRRDYDCDEDVMRLSPRSKAHTNPIHHWENWVRATIKERVPMSPHRPPRRGPGRDEDLDRQPTLAPQRANDYTPATPVRTTYAPPTPRPVDSPSDQPVRQATALVQTSPVPPADQPPRQGETRPQAPSVTQNPDSSLNPHQAEGVKSEDQAPNDAPFPSSDRQEQLRQADENDRAHQTTEVTSADIPAFSAATARLEAEDILKRVTVLANADIGIISALRKVIQGKEVSVPEEMGIIRAIETNKNYREEFSSLRSFLQPILNRPISREERKLWAKKAREIKRYAIDFAIISPKARSALQALEDGAILSPTDKNALEYMAQRLRRQGIELLELIREE